MSKNLVKFASLDKPIILRNRTASVADNHAEKIGFATVANSIQDAIGRADIIWSCFSGEASVQESFATILNQDMKGKLFLECSTISPDATDEIAKRILKAGAEFVAMPGK